MMLCPLCRNAAEHFQPSTEFGVGVNCAICGIFTLDRFAMPILNPEHRADVRLRLSVRARQLADRGERLHITRGNFEELARLEPIAWSRKVLRLMEIVRGEATHPGEFVMIDSRLVRTRLGGISAEEHFVIARHLAEKGLLRSEPTVIQAPASGFGQNDGLNWNYALTPDGWLQLEPLGGAGVPGTGFVAMAFNPELAPAYDDGIRPAIEDDCGLKAIRVDREEHNDDITDRILSSIRSAQFVVADFTYQRPGVYFEAGFALGLGRVVIWTCRADDQEGLHFDTRQYNHIIWSSPEELRGKLADRIHATVALPARF